jgi:two-component system, LuxR family, sensor kinase FixL
MMGTGEPRHPRGSSQIGRLPLLQSAPLKSALSGVAIPVCVAAAYYAGAALGLALKLPDSIPSVLWPPNAILMSALLLTSRRSWPIVLLAPLPVHILLERAVGWPLSVVLALFATNCSEALLGAIGLRWLSDAPTKLDSPRRFGIFVGVVAIAAPLLSSFLDAGVVSLMLGDPYWSVWRARLFSNILSALLVVPSVITVVTMIQEWPPKATRSRWIEAMLLVGSLLVVTRFVLQSEGPDPLTTTLADRAPIAILLPFLVWAAVRFGPGGAALSLLVSVLALAGAAVHSRGPFTQLSPTETTLVLQLSLTLVALTLLGVAAAAEERRQIQQSLSSRLAFEALLGRLSGAFVQLPSDRMHGAFDEALRKMGEFLSLDRLLLFQYSEADDELTRVAAWVAPGVEDVRGVSAPRDFPWSMSRLVRGQPVIIESPDQFPEEAELDRRMFERYGFQSAAAIPLLGEHRLLGVFTATSARPAPNSPMLLRHLQLVAVVLGNALARKETEDLLRKSETMKSAILTSLTSGVVVVDRHGCIIAVNERWRRFVSEDAPANATEVGANHLEFYRLASRAGHAWAAEVALGIQSVLHGSRPNYVFEHISHYPIPNQWFVMRVVPLDRPEGGAVITHTDVSERKRAELEVERMRGDLAHVSRVSTMGALTASLAHQLNQPLTGILTNAQAALRLLEARSPNLDEVCGALADIVEDNRRASDVIVRLRDLLRRGDGSLADVDVNALVSDVARLLSSDAVIRNTTVELQTDAPASVVRGDRVQLQQVVLNLMVNALEAVADQPPRDRKVIVRCTPSLAGFVEISVIDSGPGFDSGSEEQLFEAFYTTKRGGMGMGLSIARSIVEAHGGEIRAGNNSFGGATVSCRLPLAYAAVA